MENEDGFTIIELLIAIAAGLCVIGAGFLIYAAIHFIGKNW